MKPKIIRSRNGCATCKKRRRKCDETKPSCLNCTTSGRKCEGYIKKLVFDVDDSRKDMKKGFKGRPRKQPELHQQQQQGKLVAQIEQINNENSKKVDSIQKSIESLRSSAGKEIPETPVMDQNMEMMLTRDGSLQSMVSSEDFDFTDEKQFETAIFTGLDYILDHYDNELLNNIDNLSPPSDVTPTNLATPITPIQPSGNVKTLIADDHNAIPKLKKKEESHILKHFFSKVIYLLDAHPQNPWPQLMMKFGSVDLAKSCFLSLSSMHLYVNNGGDDFYKKGLMHINNTMEYLIKYVKSSDAEINIPSIISKIKVESSKKVEKNKNFMVILLLLYVHLLFAILESGRSALSRMFLKLAASIADDPTFNRKLKKIKQSQHLICVLCWWDTVSALVSPDCRIPYHSSRWFGESRDIISTDQMSGCAVGTFCALYDLSVFRNDNMNLFSQKNVNINEIKLNYQKLIDLRFRFSNYRDHVMLNLPTGSTYSYIDRLKCAQLWSIAGILQTIQLEVHFFANYNTWIRQNRNFIHDSELPPSVPTQHYYNNQSTALVTEFLSVYNTLPSESPIITQMVWPIFYVSLCSYSSENRQQAWSALETLYENVKMGTIKSIMSISQQVWDNESSIESILGGEGWLENGIDLLPC